MPSHYLRHNLYATTSGVFSHAALLGAVQAIGADRLLFAVDYPYESTAEAVDFLRTAPFSRADLKRIAHRNAAHLLNL
ncbi:amidohydrolase family protein [Streptomyces violaceus]|uniref:Amidohydrolase family protein n=1 Tax=Streptomyces violaceus TaxID=1936 RepID=A0ABZ1P5J9_STRVL